MVISPALHTILLATAGLAAAASLFAVLKLRKGSARALRAAQIALAVTIPLGLYVLTFARQHVAVHDADGKLVVERSWRLGASFSYSTRTEVTNESSHPLTLVEVIYAENAPDPIETPIAPGGSFAFTGDLDYVGPTNEPPSYLDSKNDRESRFWLTW